VKEMEPLDLADKLRLEADKVLEMVHLPEILPTYGKVFTTGSYYLDVMAYPDIDLYITKISVEQIFAIGAQIAACGQVTQVVFEPTDDPVHMPHGLYLKARVNYGQWGRPWKIDLWSLAESVILGKMVDMQRFKQKMTPEQRELIVRYKQSIMTPLKRAPMYSGYYIYKAILDEGMVDFESITRYLASYGIRMEG
jgi:hypothetical protein